MLEQQGQFGKLSDALFWFNLAQVLASLIMLKMARAWVGRRSTIIVAAALSILGALGAITFTSWWSIASATLMSLTSGILLILLVAVPPLVTTSPETGRLSAGTFLVGYTLAFSIPMLGGLIADWTGDARHAILTIIAYSLLVLPRAFTLDLKPKDQPGS